MTDDVWTEYGRETGKIIKDEFRLIAALPQDCASSKI
jgi:hypothetical protein